MNDLLVLSPCFYPNLNRVRFLVESARIHNIPLHLYGVGEQFKGWIDSHITRLMEELRRSTQTHFLFVDAIDTFFLSGLGEICEKYESYSSPLLLAAYEESGLNAGCFMGRRDWMVDCLNYLATYKDEGDPQERWRSFKTDVIRLDRERGVFQCMNEGDLDIAQLYHHQPIYRLRNKQTSQYPSILHFCGGYCDPEQGRIERMQPWWDKCYGHKG